MGSGDRSGRRRVLTGLAVAPVAAALWLAGASVAQAACAEDRVTVIGDFGRAAFTVAIADEPAEQAQGLMFVEDMAMFDGMLFVFPRPAPRSFWMRNTLIPLDILFADETGRLITVHQNAIPLDETGIPGGDRVQYVLEINGGLSDRLGIEVGDVLQHPAIGAMAAAPCP